MKTPKSSKVTAQSGVTQSVAAESVAATSVTTTAVRGKRIAVVSHSHPSISKGGAEIAAYTLFHGLRRLGYDAVFIGACQQSQRGKIELGPNEYAFYYDPHIYDHFYHLASSDVSAQLLTLIRDLKIDLLNFHHFFNLGLAAFKQAAQEASVVFTIHEFLSICHNHGQMITRPAQILCSASSPNACGACFPEYSSQQFALRKQNFLESLSLVDAFVSPSHFLADRFVAWGLEKERMNVIENGLMYLHPPHLAQHSENHIWKFGFFGQINPFKGVDIILQACELISKKPALAAGIRILIHGNLIGQSDAFVKKFEAALEEYDFLSYLGPYNNSSVNSLMENCDYILMPSRWWENSPVVIQEAYAVKRPLICTGIGGMAEKVINNVSGLHFAFNDPADLMAVIEKGASATVHNALVNGIPGVLTAEDMAQQYLSVFNSVKSRAVSEPAEVPAE
ncbi:glycosyl transferase group 1 family protein [Asticcacaulis biprosthecium C19]|uniref:Glycosyl transferase group 1 family protein n=1 Tax=Asticcacaulis biprosthecium C19 TaxID=715226 RepID=F4QLZ9_9CAUL|nr:glycosyltransferase family 4 protein [Asticcacaulis biprosthecium]EGF93571.1 glycosyl transferase group 1 family protein [Asticcacaulis biprosthecium C19]